MIWSRIANTYKISILTSNSLKTSKIWSKTYLRGKTGTVGKISWTILTLRNMKTSWTSQDKIKSNIWESSMKSLKVSLSSTKKASRCRCSSTVIQYPSRNSIRIIMEPWKTNPEKPHILLSILISRIISILRFTCKNRSMKKIISPLLAAMMMSSSLKWRVVVSRIWKKAKS